MKSDVDRIRQGFSNMNIRMLVQFRRLSRVRERAENLKVNEAVCGFGDLDLHEEVGARDHLTAS